MEAGEYIRAAADMLLPRECIVCGRKLGIREEHLCIGCAAELPFTHFETMPHNPMADKFNALIQKDLETKEPFPKEDYALGTALFYYNNDNGYENIPKALKYEYNIAAGKYFAEILGRKMIEGGIFYGQSGVLDKHGSSAKNDIPPVDAVVPVPLHWARKWKRGYNQAEIIAAELAKALDAPLWPNLLKRHRRTATQTRLTIAEKEKNVHNAFCINEKSISGFKANHILLVDDVFTTGSTLHACRKALRQGLHPNRSGDTAVSESLVFPRISIATLAYVGEL